MKTRFSFVLSSLALIILAACSKTDPADTSNTKPNLTGTWQWVNTVTGWGATTTPSTDSVVTLRVFADSTYSLSLNNQIKYSGSFFSFTTAAPENRLVLHFDQNMTVHKLMLPRIQSLMQYQNDSLRLYDYQLADGSTHLFLLKH